MLVTLALLTALHASPATDSLSGTWQFTGDVGGNALDVTCTLTQTGAALSGECPGPTGERVKVSGEVKDGKVILRQPGDYQGQALTIVYTATSVSARSMKGTIEVLPFSVTGTFSAAPAPAKP